jgi:hypothetical protein
MPENQKRVGKTLLGPERLARPSGQHHTHSRLPADKLNVARETFLKYE